MATTFGKAASALAANPTPAIIVASVLDLNCLIGLNIGTVWVLSSRNTTVYNFSSHWVFFSYKNQCHQQFIVSITINTLVSISAFDSTAYLEGACALASSPCNVLYETRLLATQRPGRESVKVQVPNEDMWVMKRQVTHEKWHQGQPPRQLESHGTKENIATLAGKCKINLRLTSLLSTNRVCMHVTAQRGNPVAVMCLRGQQMSNKCTSSRAVHYCKASSQQVAPESWCLYIPMKLRWWPWTYVSGDAKYCDDSTTGRILWQLIV